MATFYSGDTRPFTGVLKLGPNIVVIDPSDIITAKFVDPKTKTDITNAFDCPSSNDGSNWAVGRISVAVPSVESVKLATFAGKTVTLVVQLESTILGKKEFQVGISIKLGYTP